MTNLESSDKKHLNEVKVSSNLVMFEYIDQLLHGVVEEEKSSEIVDDKKTASVEIETQETYKKEELTQSAIDVSRSIKENLLEPSFKEKLEIQDIKKKPDFKDPINKDPITSSLKNIQEDLIDPIPSIENFDESRKIKIEKPIDKDQIEPNNPINSLQEITENSKETMQVQNEEVSDVKSNEKVGDIKNEESLIEDVDLKSLNDFDCVMVKVDSMLLALPMSVLGTINKIDDEPTKLPGKPNWFLGVHNIDEKRRFNLINTQDVLFTERQKQLLKNKEGKRQFSINVFGTNWALACDEVIGSIRVENSDVQWRNDTYSQIIAGTLRSKMCMLINVSKLIGKLTKQNVLNDL